MKIKSYILILFIPFVFSSCLEQVDYEIVEKPVIDGWIDSDGSPVVIFTSSIIPGETNPVISDHVIKWGVVKIIEGTDTTIMTGGPNHEYFPPYIYTVRQMKGEPGHTYKIVADYKDLHAEAQCYMPYPTPIQSVSISHIEGEDSLRSAEIRFTAPADCPAFYYVTMRESGNQGRFFPTLMGVYKAINPNEEIAIPLLHPKIKVSNTDKEFVTQLKKGEKLEIKLCRITEDVYEFWKEYDNTALFGGSQFFNSPFSLKGNITGGYGVWSAQGVSSYSFTVD